MSPKSKAFKALQKKWYDKLAEDGFEEIESIPSEEGSFLKRWDSKRFIHKRKYAVSKPLTVNFESTFTYDPLIPEACQEYYYRATHMLENYDFASVRDKNIWELYCQGLTYREIAIRVEGVTSLLVYRTVKRLREVVLRGNIKPRI